MTLKLKTSDFVCLSRSVTVPGNGSVATAEEFELYGKRLLKAELPIELRLVGIGLQKLSFKGDTAVEPKNSITRFSKKEDPAQKGAKKFTHKRCSEKRPRRKLPNHFWECEVFLRKSVTAEGRKTMGRFALEKHDVRVVTGPELMKRRTSGRT